MKVLKFFVFMISILAASSCSRIEKTQVSSKDYLYKNHITEAQLEPNSFPQALPLLFIYFDYIKNNRCSPRKDLFDLFFKQMMNDHTKVLPLLKDICQKTTSIHSCKLISSFKMKKSKEWYGLKRIFISNLMAKEFGVDLEFVESIKKDYLKFINPDSEDNWVYDAEEFNSKSTLHPFTKSLRENKKLCLHLYDKYVIFRLKNVFVAKFTAFIYKIIKSKNYVHEPIQEEIWEELSKSIYKIQGKKYITKYLLKETASFCQLNKALNCNHQTSVSCFFLKHKELKCNKN